MVKVTTVGVGWVADVLNQDAVPSGEYIAWGSGLGEPAVGDTDIFGPETEARVLATRSNPSPNVVRWVAEIVADGSKTITNAGLFNSSTAGKLIVHGDHTGRPLVIGDKITYTFDVTIA